MSAQAIVTIIVFALIVLALVVYLVSTIFALREITKGLDEVIGNVTGILQKTEPVNEIVTSINGNLDAGVDALEGLLVKKAGLVDAMGLVDGLYPGAAAAGLRNFPESREITPPRIGEVYTKGTLTLARLGREAPIAMANPAGAVLRNVEGGSLAARMLYPEVRQSRPEKLPRSPVIGTDAPCSTSSARTSARRASAFRRRRGGLEQCRHPRHSGTSARPASRASSRRSSRLGPEARIIAGGHSLLPMMKLRLANPEHLIDINDLTELAYIREEGGEIRIGALTRHVDLLKSELLAERYPALPRRRERHRRPGRAQPRHDRRLALPGRRGRGPLGRLRRGARRGWSSAGAGGERVVPMDEFHVGPYMTAVGAGEILTEVRLDVRPGARQRPREGRAARRRLGDRRRVRGRLDRRRDDRRGGHRAQRRRPDHDPPHPRRGAAARQGAARGAVRAGRRDRVGGLLAAARRPRAGRLQATPRRRPHPPGAAPRRGARPATGGLTSTSR